MLDEEMPEEMWCAAWFTGVSRLLKTRGCVNTTARLRESRFAYLGVVYPPLEQSSSPGRSGSTQEAHHADSRDDHRDDEGGSLSPPTPLPPPPAELQLLSERLRRLLLLLASSSAAVSSL